MAVLETLALGGLFGRRRRSGNSGPSADQIYAAHTREDLQRYNEELAPLEQMYYDNLMGPQAESNRSGFLQTVGQNTDNAFDRAGARVADRNRRFGSSADRNQTRSLQRARQATKAQNLTQGARFFDQQRTDLL